MITLTQYAHWWAVEINRSIRPCAAPVP